MEVWSCLLQYIPLNYHCILPLSCPSSSTFLTCHSPSSTSPSFIPSLCPSLSPCRCGSRTGGWRINARDTPCTGPTLSWTLWGPSWWDAPLLPPRCRTPSSRTTCPTCPSTTTPRWLSPHRDPRLTVPTAHPWGPWMHSASPSTTTGWGGCLRPQQPSTPPPASCTIHLHVPAPFVCTGDQNNSLKPEGRHWDWASPVVPRPTWSLLVWSGERR